MPFRRIRDTERLQALVAAMLLVGEDIELPAVLRRIVETAVAMVDARYGALGVLDETGSGLAEFVHVGMSDEQVAAIGRLPEGRGVLGLLIKEPKSLRLDDLARHPDRAGFPAGHPLMTSFLGVPVTVQGELFGNLYLAEKRGGVFTEEDEAMVASLALAAGLAIDKARVTGRMRDLALAEERERIARDLHDTTIRRLFGVGLTLQSARRILGQPEAGHKLRAAIDELDGTIRQIRATVFAISRPGRRMGGDSLRAEALQVVEEIAEGRGLQVSVEFDGPIDDGIGRHAGEQLLLSVRQAASVAVHLSDVRRLAVEVVVDEEGLLLQVTTDGTGDPPARELASLEERARLLGGHSRLERPDEGGTRLVWRVARLQ